jgi:hypothetical protein
LIKTLTSIILMGFWLGTAHSETPPSTGTVSPGHIGRIIIIRKNIFDPTLPAENKWPYRLANKIHPSTKESVIRKTLLFKEGDPYDPLVLNESERALRKILRLRHVIITPHLGEGQSWDILINVQEAWTTEPTLSLSGVGKNFSGEVGLREKNLAGTGASGSFFYKKNAGATSQSVSYDNPHFLKDYLNLTGQYETGESAHTRALLLQKPFQSNTTPWAARLGGFSSQETTSIYAQGQEVKSFSHGEEDLSGEFSRSFGSTRRKIRRGLLFYQHQIDDLADTKILRQKQYDFWGVGLHGAQVNFITVHRVRRYGHDEDVDLGPALTFRLGTSQREWTPSSDTAQIFKTSYLHGFFYGPSRFALATLKSRGKWKKGSWKSVQSRLDLEHYHPLFPRQTWAGRIHLETLTNPDVDEQLILGGDTGLRGYALYQFSGKSRFVVNAENRIFLVDDILRLASLGAVVFADAGAILGQGESIRARNIKTNIGAGLRLHLTRTSVGHLLRLDAAYALNPVPGQSRWVLTFGSEQAF